MNAPLIHPSATIGPRVEIAEGATIGPSCRLDGRTAVGARARLEADVTVTDARIGDDCVVGEGVRIEPGCIVEPGVRIGRQTRIEAGSLVARNIHAHAVAGGDPAVVRGFVTTCDIGHGNATEGAAREAGVIVKSPVAGVELYRFRRVAEPRGVLSFAELGSGIPFEVKRYFLVHGVPRGELRGEHTHTECAELLICVQGSITVLVDDGTERQEFLLDSPDVALHIPKLIWTTQYKHTPDAILVVLASNRYQAADYIKDYETFLARRKTAA